MLTESTRATIARWINTDVLLFAPHDRPMAAAIQELSAALEAAEGLLLVYDQEGDGNIRARLTASKAEVARLLDEVLVRLECVGGAESASILIKEYKKRAALGENDAA